MIETNPVLRDIQIQHRLEQHFEYRSPFWIDILQVLEPGEFCRCVVCKVLTPEVYGVTWNSVQGSFLQQTYKDYLCQDPQVCEFRQAVRTG